MVYDPETWVDFVAPCIDAAHLNAIEHGIDIAQGDVMVLYDLTANRPAFDPELVGRLFFESDLLFRVWRDNGTGWDQVHVVAGAGGAWTFIQEYIEPPGPGSAAITFAAIPGIYRHLAMFVHARTDRVGQDIDLYAWRLNGDAGNNYDRQFVQVQGAGPFGGFPARATNMAWAAQVAAATSPANSFGDAVLYWPYYADPNSTKIGLTALGYTYGDVSADGDLNLQVSGTRWRNTVAITSITFLPNVGPNFVPGCRASLYGIT